LGVRASDGVEEEVNGDGEGGGIRLMYFIYLYKNRTMKFEIILNRGDGAEEA
jgi:hypothetical protein